MAAEGAEAPAHRSAAWRNPGFSEQVGFQARKIKTSWSPWRRHDTNGHRKDMSVEDLRQEGRGILQNPKEGWGPCSWKGEVLTGAELNDSEL